MAAVFIYADRQLLAASCQSDDFHLIEVVAFRYIGATKPKHLEEVSSGVFADTSGACMKGTVHLPQIHMLDVFCA